MEVIFMDKQYELKNFIQCEDIPYAKNLGCSCGYATYFQNRSYDVVGYCDTPQGFMMVCECPKCFEKYRHHISTQGKFDIDSFKKDIGLILHLHQNDH